MGLQRDLATAINDIFKAQWTRRKGNTVPDSDDIQLGNSGVDLEVAILYADLDSSTQLVDTQTTLFAAECYKAFLHCATKIIRNEGGHIRSFDGDRVMGIFIGSFKCSTAARCGLKINWAVKNIIQPGITAQYGADKYTMLHTVGIDQSDIMAARTGIRGANDIVWVGAAANHAAKLCAIDSPGYSTFITDSVYTKLHDDSKYGGPNKVDMWQQCNFSGKKIYRSNFLWRVE